MSVAEHHLFLAPHPDDVVYSCGGLVGELKRRGHAVTVITVCAGVPSEDMPFPNLVPEWGQVPSKLTPAILMRRRIEEDRRALGKLQVEYRPCAMLDAAFRLPETYRTFGQLMGTPSADDPLIAASRDVIDAIDPEAQVYAPLGVGGHVDHTIISDAAIASGRAVTFYEDFPYVAKKRGALKARLSRLDGTWTSRVHDVSESFDLRLEAMALYASQRGGMLRPVALEYAQSIGDGRPSERTWTRRLTDR